MAGGGSSDGDYGLQIAPMLDDPVIEPSIRRMAEKWVSKHV